MKTADIFHEMWSALSSNKARSGLTMLGIIIGISSVITLVAIGQGAQGSIQSSIQAIGSNLILITPGAQRGPGVQVSAGRGSSRTLKNDDAVAVGREVTSITAVSPELTGRYQVTSKGKNTNTSIIGVQPAYLSVRNVIIDQGDFISEANVNSGGRVAVLGPTARDDLFGIDATDVVGQTIKIKSTEFKIIGITAAKGGSGFGNQDDAIFVPLTTAQRYFVGDTYLSMLAVQAESSVVMTDVQQQVTDLLLARHHISDPTLADFSVLNQADLVAAASSITQTFTLLLGAIAGISLLVGGIGIMNMMLTTVTERTKEIGLRKAIGAKRRDISLQFLAEAVALTFVGGGIGVALGAAISFTITALGVLQSKVSIGSVLLAFGVSAGIGLVFGWYPARRAARMNPIEALRSE